MAAVIALVIGLGIGFFIRKLVAEGKIKSAENAAKQILNEAEKESKAKKKEAILEAKESIYSMKEAAEKEIREQRYEQKKQENKLDQKEEHLEKKLSLVEKKEIGITQLEESLSKKQIEAEKILKEQKEALQRVAGMSSQDAKEMLLQRIEHETKHDAAQLIKKIENEAREEAEKRSKNIISLAIQRCASDHSAETTVSVVNLPSDEMKGRIIGREGRNIRAFENLTGINLIIDDTPEAVILSSFDPVRRETARITLERLISDGRIHPARIEEMFEKAKDEVEKQIREEGEQATFDTKIHGIHQELIRVLGRLKFRTSYGQNVLQHSLEVAHLAGIMASELGSDIKIAKRAGLLHDIGKAIDYEVEGPHAIIGAELAKRLQEKKLITHAIEAHHGEIEPQTIEAVLIQAADAISGSRPGARRETLESYIQRLENLELIAESFEGVEKTYAMQAGRELRIMVVPDNIDDAEAGVLAKNVAKKIEEELVYPGQIKVTVIRESRAIEYAK